MKVSFDFDSTLSRDDVQEYAKSLVEKGYEVWIVTSRCDTDSALAKGWHWVKRQNQQLYDIAEECGIKIENIKFTEFTDKIIFLKDKNFILVELSSIQKHFLDTKQLTKQYLKKNL